MRPRDPFSVNARSNSNHLFTFLTSFFVNTELKLPSKHEDNNISPEQKFFFCV